MEVRIAKVLGVLALTTMAAPAAQAMEEGWAFEIAMGQASFTDVRTSDLAAMAADFFTQFSLDFDTQSTRLKRKDRSYAVITSFRFNENLAMETGFFRLGAFQYTSTGDVGGSSGLVPAGFDLSFRAKGVILGVSTTWPVGEVLELRGRGGISSTDTRVKFLATVQATHVADKFSASSQDFYIGAGVGANLWSYYRVGLDWMMYRNLGKSNLTYRANVSNFMLSIGYLY